MSESLSNKPALGQEHSSVELTVGVTPEAVMAELEEIDVTGGVFHSPSRDRLNEIQKNVSGFGASQFPLQVIEITMYGLELAQISSTKYGWLKQHHKLTRQYQQTKNNQRRAQISQQVERLEQDRLLVTVVEDVMYDRVTEAYISTAGYSADQHHALRVITSSFDSKSTPLLKEFDVMHKKGCIGFYTQLQCEMNARALIAAQLGIETPAAEPRLKSVEWTYGF